MTSRLQRKIALSQQPHHHSNNSSSNSQPYGNLDESFVSVGTALPSLLDSKKDANEFKPAWEQEVLDEQGRRRFHGAFTGGFSAGYFNSVGSKEGWTPSTFKSSRANRGNQAGGAGGSVVDAARQFMDDEDLAELASSRTLETSSAYASRSAAPPPSATSAKADYDPLLGLFGPLPSSSRPSASTSTEAPSSAAGVFDSTLASLIAPSESRIGLKLMRKMGWREGQGVGPRIALSERKKQAKELGIVLPSSEEGEEAEGGEAEKHLYPPLDRRLTLVKGTSASGDRGWGLGYQPGMTLDARLRNEGSVGGGGGARQTFYEEDEEDAYGAAAGGPGRLGERERRALGAYEDEEMDEDFDRIKRTGSGRNAKSTPKRFTRQQEFVDGSQVLPGFTLEVNAIAGPSTSRLPPPPPPGWQPDPTRLWKENAPPSSANANGKGKGRQLDAEERGSLLGEKLPPPPSPMPKSVFDYLSAKSCERLATVTSGRSAPPPSAAPNSSRPPPSGLTGANNAPLGASSRFGNASSTSAPPQPPPAHIAEPDAQLFVPPLDRPTALSALRGFQPYSAASTSPDPIKQARYTLYLQYQSSDSASTTSSPFGPRTLPNGKQQTVEELNRELNEYAQAARVFKPVSGMLGNRFQTSQTGAFDAPKIEPGLWQPPPKASKPAGTDSLTAAYGDASSASSAPQKPPEPALTPAQQAARAGNFGVGTTRTVSAFRPSKLLCKRFGVRDPFESSDGSGDAGGEDAGGKFGEATATGWGTGNAAPGAGAGGAKEAVSKEAMEEMMNSVGFKRFQAAAEAEDSVTDGEVAKGVFETPELFAGGSGGVGGGARKGQPRVKPTLETVGLGDDEEQGQEIVEEMRAPADIFKAIFADSDDDSSDDEVEEENQPVVAVVPAAATASTDPFPPPPPPPPAAILVTEEPVISLSLSDLASLKPSFVSRDASTSTSTSKKEKKSSSSGKSKSKRKAATLSFDVDDGGEGEEGGREEERARERKRVRKEKEKKEKAREEEKREVKPAAGQAATALEAVLVVEEEDEWAEAAPQVHPSILAREKSEGGGGEKKGRVRAADLY